MPLALPLALSSPLASRLRLPLGLAMPLVEARLLRLLLERRLLLDCLLLGVCHSRQHLLRLLDLSSSRRHLSRSRRHLTRRHLLRLLDLALQHLWPRPLRPLHLLDLALLPSTAQGPCTCGPGR